MSDEKQIETMVQFNKKTKLIIIYPNDIISYEIEDKNTNSLYDLFSKAGDKIKKYADECKKIFIGANNELINNVEVHNEAMLKLCDFLSSKGYVIGIIQYDSTDNEEVKYNVRLYVHQSYFELNNTSNQYFTIEHICRRLNLEDIDIDINKKINTMIATVNIGSCVIFEGKQQLSKSFKDQSNYIIRVLHGDNLGLIVRPDGYCIREKISIYNPKLIYKPIEDKISGIQSHRKQCLICTVLHNSFSYDTSQKVLYIPKNILDNELQLKTLESILKEYEDMRKSNNNLPFSLTIYVDGVFLKKISNDSYKWNGEGDYAFSKIMEEIRNRLKRIREQEEAR